MTTAVLIDDHAVFREGLRYIFESLSGPRVVGETSRPEEAGALVEATSPDVVVLDMMFRDSAEGIAAAGEILQRRPDARILFCTMCEDAEKIAAAIHAGALGYVTKDQSAPELLRAVHSVARGIRYLPDALRRRGESHGATRSERLALLTSREREVFDLTVAGLTSSATGTQLGISARTVETHRARILSKLQARSATDLVRLAAGAGLLPRDDLAARQ
jgi:DNA-binding NarL/FixJ family response regulator